MYESPIQIIYGEVQMQLEDGIMKAVQSYDIQIDKDELIKAILYDRDQYNKGYSDGRRARENEIINCYDCRYYAPCYREERELSFGKCICPLLLSKVVGLNATVDSIIVDGMFYCGYGKRKDDDEC